MTDVAATTARARMLRDPLVPVAAGVGVFGLTFGGLARTVGFSPVEAIVMSVLVFAGSAQFAVVAALRVGGSEWTAIVAGVALNLRLLPLASVGATGFRTRGWRRVSASYAVTDESIALSGGRDGRINGRRLVIAGLALAAVWTLGTAVGSLGSSMLGEPERFGLDVAFPAGFVALLAPRLRSDPGSRRVAFAGGVLALVSTPMLPAGLPLVLAVLAVVLAPRRQDDREIAAP